MRLWLSTDLLISIKSGRDKKKIIVIKSGMDIGVIDMAEMIETKEMEEEINSETEMIEIVGTGIMIIETEIIIIEGMMIGNESKNSLKDQEKKIMEVIRKILIT